MNRPANPRLHLLLHPQALEDCLAQVCPVDTVVCMDQGVLLLDAGQAMTRLSARASTVVVSGPDAQARALASTAGPPEVDDQAVVALIAAHARIMSWS